MKSLEPENNSGLSCTNCQNQLIKRVDNNTGSKWKLTHKTNPIGKFSSIPFHPVTPLQHIPFPKNYSEIHIYLKFQENHILELWSEECSR